MLYKLWVLVVLKYEMYSKHEFYAYITSNQLNEKEQHVIFV